MRLLQVHLVIVLALALSTLPAVKAAVLPLAGGRPDAEYIMTRAGHYGGGSAIGSKTPPLLRSGGLEYPGMHGPHFPQSQALDKWHNTPEERRPLLKPGRTDSAATRPGQGTPQKKGILSQAATSVMRFFKKNRRRSIEEVTSDITARASPPHSASASASASGSKTPPLLRHGSPDYPGMHGPHFPQSKALDKWNVKSPESKTLLKPGRTDSAATRPGQGTPQNKGMFAKTASSIKNIFGKKNRRRSLGEITDSTFDLLKRAQETSNFTIGSGSGSSSEHSTLSRSKSLPPASSSRGADPRKTVSPGRIHKDKPVWTEWGQYFSEPKTAPIGVGRVKIIRKEVPERPRGKGPGGLSKLFSSP